MADTFFFTCRVRDFFATVFFAAALTRVERMGFLAETLRLALVFTETLVFGITFPF